MKRIDSSVLIVSLTLRLFATVKPNATHLLHRHRHHSPHRHRSARKEMKVNVNYYDVVVNGILLASILNCNYVNAGATRDVQVSVSLSLCALYEWTHITMCSVFLCFSKRSEYINPKHNTLKQQYQWRNLIGDANDQQSKHHSIHKHHQKRQIYREQVLPHAGGKIPDSAFDTDRLALNRLQKDGIAVPDGVLLEQRNPHVFQYASKSRRPVYTVKQFSDQRFTAAAGQGTGPDGSKTVETTYSLPQIVHHTLTVPRDPIEPVLQSIELPNPLLQSGPPKRREQYGMNVSCGPRPHQHHAQALSSNPFANHFSYSKSKGFAVNLWSNNCSTTPGDIVCLFQSIWAIHRHCWTAYIQRTCACRSRCGLINTSICHKRTPWRPKPPLHLHSRL